MDIILNKVLKNKIIKAIQLYTVDDINELVLDFPLSDGTFDSIEYIESTNDVVLHKFESDFDYCFLFEDFSSDDKLRIFQILKGIQHLD